MRGRPRGAAPPRHPASTTKEYVRNEVSKGKMVGLKSERSRQGGRIRGDLPGIRDFQRDRFKTPRRPDVWQRQDSSRGKGKDIVF